MSGEEDPFNKIIHEWKLTFDADTDFPIATIKTYLRENPYARLNNEHTVIEILRLAIRRIAAGLDEIKKEDKAECLYETLVRYINYDILEEEKHQRKTKKIIAELEKQRKKKNRKQGSSTRGKSGNKKNKGQDSNCMYS